jgi:superfamily II DNA or RNA helicase
VTGVPWPEPIATTSGESAAAILRQLWLEAERVEAVVRNPERLRDLVSPHRLGEGPRQVRLVSGPSPNGTLPKNWCCTPSDRTPALDLLLFYREGSSFPDSALVFTGGIGSRAWVTYYRRPFVLHHLRQRFRQLADEASQNQPLGIGSLREEPARPAAAWEATSRHETGAAQLVTPATLYRRVLAAHFAGPVRNTGDRHGPWPTLADHQARAYERACDIIDRYGGVIIADAVGLGKTYIGLRLLQRTLDEGGRVIVVLPAALRQQWERELTYLVTGATAQADAERQDPENLDLWLREDGPVALLSMEALGRRGFDVASHQGAELVLVDEAHNFRNPATRRYRALSDLVRHSQVALLTATPINNSLLDLQCLIDLFAAPATFRHLGVPNYREAFRRAIAGTGDVRPIVTACVLRRTRRFLRRHYGTVRLRDPSSGDERELRFPERRPPSAVDYDLAGTYRSLFAELENWMEALRFPTVGPESGDDRAADQDACPGELLKIILLKRLESSIAAFRATVVQQLAWCDTALRALDAGRVLTRPDYRASFKGPADDPGSQLAFFELMLPAPSLEPARLSEFRGALETDRSVLARIHAALAAVGPADDGKLQKLTALLDGSLADRKLLIFTEFRDTARYLYNQLKDRPFVAQIDSESARLGLERASRADVIERFAPRSNNRPEPPARERVDVLIATDVLSEGLNLQDASAVVSYDLPWNPVRLMQRIGRIDRLGAVHDTVELHHFLPVHDLERLLGLMDRLQRKVSAIQGTLGLDQPVLGESTGGRTTIEQVQIITREPDGYERVEEDVEGPLDPEEQAYIDCVQLLEEAPTAAPGDDSAGPVAAAVVDPEAISAQAVAYWRLSCGSQAHGLWMVYDAETGCVAEDQASAVAALRRATVMPPAETPGEPIAKARRTFFRHAQSARVRWEAARIAGDALHPNLPQCRIAAWLNQGFTTTRHRLSRRQRTAMDRLLECLARRFTAAGERSLAALFEALPDRPSPAVLDRLEGELQALEPGAGDRIDLVEVATLILVPARLTTR